MAITVRITSCKNAFRYNCNGTRNTGSTYPLSLGSYEWSEGVLLWTRKTSDGGNTVVGTYKVGAGNAVDMRTSPYYIDFGSGLGVLKIPPNCADIPDGSSLAISYEFPVDSTKDGYYPNGLILKVADDYHLFPLHSSSMESYQTIEFDVPDGMEFKGFENQQSASTYVYTFEKSTSGVIKNSTHTQTGNHVVAEVWFSVGLTTWGKADAILESATPPGPVMKDISIFLDKATNAYIKSGNKIYSTPSTSVRIGYFTTTDETGATVVFQAKANGFDDTYQHSRNLNTTASSPATVVKDDNVSATITIPQDLSYYADVNEIHISVSASSGWMPVDWTLPNATAEPQPEWWQRSVGMVTRIVPNGGYVIKTCEVKHANLPSSKAEIVFNLDGTVSISVPSGAGDLNQPLVIVVTTEQVSSVDHIIVQALNHCTSNIASDTVPDGGDVSFTSGVKISLTAEAGYVWETPPNAQVEYSGTTYDGLLDGDVVVFNAPVTGITGDIRIRATAILNVEPSESLDLGFVNVYHPSKEELLQAANSSWWGQDKVPEYIVSIYKTFIKPVEGNQKTAIRFGPFNTQAYAFPVVDQYAIVDCGVITIPEKFNSSLDYQPVTELMLWLPFIGMQAVSTADVMAIPVSLKYKMNVLTGDVIAELRNNDNGVLIGVWTGTCKEKITVWVNGRWEQENLQPGMNAITMSDRTPCFIRRTGKVVDAENSSQLDKSVKKYVNLSDVSGWAKFDRVQVDGIIATSEEKNEIEQLLMEGVIL